MQRPTRYLHNFLIRFRCHLVDICRIGSIHADCEAVLINNGSKQEKIWGADWIPSTKEIRYEALINIRPKDNNPSMTVLDPDIRARIKEIVERLMV